MELLDSGRKSGDRLGRQVAQQDDPCRIAGDGLLMTGRQSETGRAAVRQLGVVRRDPRHVKVPVDDGVLGASCWQEENIPGRGSLLIIPADSSKFVTNFPGRED